MSNKKMVMVVMVMVVVVVVVVVVVATTDNNRDDYVGLDVGFLHESLGFCVALVRIFARIAGQA
jgi:hypothetical protein